MKNVIAAGLIAAAIIAAVMLYSQSQANIAKANNDAAMKRTQVENFQPKTLP